MRIPNHIVRPSNKESARKAGGPWATAWLGQADGIYHRAWGSGLPALVPTGLGGRVLVRRAFAVGAWLAQSPVEAYLNGREGPFGGL